MNNQSRENQLNNIIKAIKKINESRNDQTTISDDSSNEEFLNILRSNVSCEEIQDTENWLCDYFGLDGYHAIREAEQGYC
ncbi:MAG: hypothetical protein JKY80_02075 [Mariprofundaceae bacterium]|nr:hypothetical protein [Methylophaga sp.]MBL4759628.1 hypothetical protein [Mariprofundaceae bacterium]